MTTYWLINVVVPVALMDLNLLMHSIMQSKS
jgi:hypothetical protein